MSKMKGPARVFVRPAREGLRVAVFPPRDWRRRHLDPEGEVVVCSVYWRRRELGGDVTVEAIETAGKSRSRPAASRRRPEPEPERSSE